MAAEDSELFTKRIRVENKILFVDVRQNSTGMYLKLSEKRGMKRNSIIIPASGISDLHETLAEALSVASQNETTPNKVAVSPAPAKSAPQAAKSTLPATNSVKVVNLAFSTTEEGLANHFRAVGNVVKATIILRKSKDSELSSGRGIVEFDDAAGVAKAQTLHESELDGRKIAVQGGKREGKAPAAPAAAPAAAASAPKAAKVPGGPAPDKVASPTKVFVTNLSWETTDTDLETYFSRIGAVKSAIVKKSKSGRSFGQGIVEFVADSDTAEAIDRLNNTELDGRSITIRPFYESAESA